MKQFESFFWGIIAALGATVVQLIFFIVFSTFSDPNGELAFVAFFSIPSFIFFIALIEELLKYLMLKKRILEISDPNNLLANILLMGFGFFALELGLMLTKGSFVGLQTAAGIAVFHLSTTLILGYFIATNARKKISLEIMALALTTAFHTLYNLAVSKETALADYAVDALLIFLLLISIRIFTRLRKALAQEPESAYTKDI